MILDGGKVEYWIELRENVAMFMQRSDAFDIPDRVKKYESYGVPFNSLIRKDKAVSEKVELSYR